MIDKEKRFKIFDWHSVLWSFDGNITLVVAAAKSDLTLVIVALMMFGLGYLAVLCHRGERCGDPKLDPSRPDEPGRFRREDILWSNIP